MQWLSIALKVISALITYGPKLWDLGVKAYHIVEMVVGQFKRSNPTADSEEVKELADKQFEEVLVRVAEESNIAVPAPKTITQLRRDVWATRPENAKKVRTGRNGRKPTA